MRITQTVFKEFTLLPEFEKDFNNLLKKFRTLEDDFENFVKAQLNLYHKRKIDNRGIFPIAGLNTGYPRIYKAKKFVCRSLKGTGYLCVLRGY